jgi:hypothetical protein
MRSSRDAWDQLCDDVDQLRRAGQLSEAQLDQIGHEADRLYCVGALSDKRLLRLSRALLSPEDFARIDGIAYGIAKLLHTPLDQFTAEVRMPGLVGRGVVLQNPHDPPDFWHSAYEVRWLRGYPIPALPPSIDGYPVKLVLVDIEDLPVPQ